MLRHRTTFFLAVILLLITATTLLVLYARGYKFDFRKKTLQPTGLIVATSVPNGASVLANSKLLTATNNTVALTPGEYQIEIKKDGFLPWKKTLTIEKEIVTKAEAYLFPAVPDLRSLTYTGAQNPVLSPDGTKLAYAVSFSENDELTIKAGLWIIDLTDGPFGLASREPRQIVKSAHRGRDFTQSEYQWSPDSRQLLVTFNKNSLGEENFVLDPNQLTLGTQLIDVTNQLPLTIKQWQKDTDDKKEVQLSKLPEGLTEILKTAAADLVWSPDNTKLLYTATAPASIPEKLIAPLPGSSTQTQERHIKPNKTYTYDIKEDRNFYIWDTKHETRLSWLPTSQHLLLVEPEKITIMDYDGTNRQEVYSGFFEYPYVFPAPSVNKLILLTRLTSDETSPLNLYALSLR